MKEENNFDFETFLDLIKNSKIKDFYEKYKNWIISVGFSLIFDFIFSYRSDDEITSDKDSG